MDKRDLAMGSSPSLFSPLQGFGDFLQLLFRSEEVNREESEEISNPSTCLCIHIFISALPLDCHVAVQ